MEAHSHRAGSTHTAGADHSGPHPEDTPQPRDTTSSSTTSPSPPHDTPNSARLSPPPTDAAEPLLAADAANPLSVAPVDDLPPYAPPTPTSLPPPTRRARNLLSALDTLRLPATTNANGAPKRCTLTHHLALFDELVSGLEDEGVHMSPSEKGWALVRSCPALRLMDVWFNVSVRGDRAQWGRRWSWTV